MTNEAPYRILVIDDEPRLRQVCHRILEPQGLEVCEATNGREGLLAIDRDRPDLVLVDLMMPVMDGMEVLAAARQRHPDLPFVVVTGYATLEKAVEAMKQGADDFLAKPFKPQELRSVVERVLSRARTVQDLAIEKSRTRALVDAMTNGVLVVDAAGQVALVNPALAALLDADPAELRERPLEEAIPCPEVVGALQTVLSSGQDGPGDVECQSILGDPEEPVHLQVHCAPFVDGRGHLVGALAVFDDVTALRRLDELKSQFVSMVAHEIASPLGSVLSQLQTLRKGLAGQLNERQLHFVDRAGLRIQGIVDLSKDLLDLAKIEAGTMGEMEACDLGAIVADAVEMLTPRAQEKGHQLQLSAATGLPRVKGIPRALGEVAVNLISNAIKYTPEGGHISVGLGQGDGVVELKVADDGLGIAPEDQEAVFQRFHRVKNADTRQIVGTGLGLPIVKKVVEEHGGSIALTSVPGQGSTFTVRLPVSD